MTAIFPESLKLLPIDKETAVQEYTYVAVSNAALSFEELVIAMKAEPHVFTRNSMIQKYAPVDAKGNPVNFAVGTYMPVRIGTNLYSYMEIGSIEESDTSFSFTIAALEGNYVCGTNRYDLMHRAADRIDFCITSWSDFHPMPNQVEAYRERQRAAWKEILDRFVERSGGSEIKREGLVIDLFGMKTTLHKAATRGQADIGWLKSHFSFNFGEFHDPLRTKFGVLRGINEDVFMPGSGFPMHAHYNMEILTVMLQGEMTDEAFGEKDIIRSNEVQLLSAGTGASHAVEFSKEDGANLFQIWFLPRAKDIQPRRSKMAFDKKNRHNRLQTIVSPDEAGTLHANQDAWVSLGMFDRGVSIDYATHQAGQGVYIMVIEGQISIRGQVLDRRDALEVRNTAAFSFTAEEKTEILLIEIPMDEQIIPGAHIYALPIEQQPDSSESSSSTKKIVLPW